MGAAGVSGGPRAVLGRGLAWMWATFRGSVGRAGATLKPQGLAQAFVSLRQTAVWVFRALVAVALLCLCVYAARAAEAYARTSATFAIREIEIAGNTRLTREEVLKAAGIRVGMNVFKRAPEVAEADLERHPWIASAAVRRRLPGFLELEVREHLPVATLFLNRPEELGAKGYLIGDEGTVFKELGAEDPTDLPVVTGVAAERFASDAQFQSSVLLSVVALLHDWRAAGLWRRSPISEIHLERGDGLSVYSGDPLYFAQLGTGPFRQKLRRLRKILDRLDEAKTPPEYIYLNNTRRPDRVTLRLKPLPELVELPEDVSSSDETEADPT